MILSSCESNVHSATIMSYAMQGVWTGSRAAATIHTPPTYRSVYTHHHRLELFHDPQANSEDFGQPVAEEGKHTLSLSRSVWR